MQPFRNRAQKKVVDRRADFNQEPDRVSCEKSSLRSVEDRGAIFPLVRLTSLGFLCLLLTIGCATTSDKVSRTGELLPEKEEHAPYHLAALDRVDFTLSDGTRKSSKLDLQGDLQTELGAHLMLLGLTLPEAELKLRAAFPTIVKIHWTEYREASVSVLGEVYNQTKVDISDTPLRVLDVVAAAGGFTPLANLGNVVLVRNNAGETRVFILNLEAATRGSAPQFNMLVEPGDVITIRRTLL